MAEKCSFSAFFYPKMRPARSLELSKWHRELLIRLFDHCRLLFSGTRLPSHDHHHHLRVWKYAVDLLGELHDRGHVLSDDEITLLLLAVFFHDTGLTRTLDFRHGMESLDLCLRFLRENPVISPSLAAPALEAIEYHDQKETPVGPGLSSGNDILKILTVCDDADAYGPAGILRYAEIYLLREIPVESLAPKVLKNLASRFEYLSAQEWVPEHFLANQCTRYRYAAGFYRSLEANFGSGKKEPAELLIINSYMEDVYRRSGSLAQFAARLKGSPIPEIRAFGGDLLSELKQADVLYQEMGRTGSCNK
jgi:hypothetical protein